MPTLLANKFSRPPKSEHEALQRERQGAREDKLNAVMKMKGRKGKGDQTSRVFPRSPR